MVFHGKEKPLMIVMVGLAGSGKSTLAKDILIERNGVMERPHIHSSNDLRVELLGDINDQDHNQDVFRELHKRVKEDLKNGIDVIYDATNLNKKRRAAFNRELTRIPCDKVCICVATPYEQCLLNRENSDRKIPKSEMRRMYQHWTPPHSHEGFDKIIISYGCVNFHNYDIDNEITALSKIDHENAHHTLSIGDHCSQASKFLLDKGCDEKLVLTALLHDIGKKFTKTYINSRGEKDGEAHYYQHQHVGAYDSLFYTKNLGLCTEDQLEISNLIYYHMHPHMSWKQSNKSMNRDRRFIGDEMFHNIMTIHEADAYAHIVDKQFDLVKLNDIFVSGGLEEIERE